MGRARRAREIDLVEAEYRRLRGGRRVRETPDIETSSDDYASRFSGPVGAWMLEVQERAVRALLGAPAGGTLLDVGGGHGQLAGPLAAPAGASRCSAAPPSAPGGSARRRRRPCGSWPATSSRCRFPTARSTCVVSVRLLPHCERWPALVAELCRVARHAVVVDYPTRESLNRVAPALFGAKKRLEGNTRTFTLFTHREIEAAFAASGYRAGGRVGQFFLPMVLHRALRCRPCSAALEAVCRGLGLTRRWGSPVVARFSRTRPAEKESILVHCAGCGRAKLSVFDKARDSADWSDPKRQTRDEPPSGLEAGSECSSRWRSAASGPRSPPGN